MADELHFSTIAQTAELIRSRKISPVELAQTYLKRIAELDPQLNAFITVTADLALAQAREAEQEIAKGNYRGPLHGIPFGLKDIYNTRGILTSGALEGLRGQHSGRGRDDHDASCARRAPCCSASSRRTSSRTAAPPSICRGRRRAIPGTSSISPAAPRAAPAPRVAAGLAPFALGSDTGGSIRGPASHCGLAGLMPTYGLVSRAGVIPNSFTFDHCGPMAWTVEDCAIVLQALAGYDPARRGQHRAGRSRTTAPR